jgi:glycosyltransferase involved in cell wall biosynthesis
LKQGGYAISGVFGLAVGDNAEMREVNFFDRFLRAEPANRTRAALKKEKRAIFRQAIHPFAARQLLDVPITERIEKSTFEHRMPAFDQIVSYPQLFEAAFEHFRLYGKFLKVRMSSAPEIMHWTYPVPVRLEGARNIYTMHDLVPLRLPYATLDGKASYDAIIREVAKTADHICTVSEASRADIIEMLNVPPEKVTNTYQSSPLPPEILHSDPSLDGAMIEGVFGLKAQSYFLYFGAIEPKKNVGRLLEAYLSIDTATRLVIVGGRAWQSEDELRLLPAGDNVNTVYGRNIADRVGRLDYLPRPLLLRLIRSAKAVVFPSLYEGFGLPVVEAMQLGTPVLTSSTSCLPEIAGDAAIFADPYSVTAIAEGLRRLDGDAMLRAQLSAAGLERASVFSESRYLKRLEDMYARVIELNRAGR